MRAKLKIPVDMHHLTYCLVTGKYEILACYIGIG
jgi:hypothetical protein